MFALGKVMTPLSANIGDKDGGQRLKPPGIREKTAQRLYTFSSLLAMFGERDEKYPNFFTCPQKLGHFYAFH